MLPVGSERPDVADRRFLFIDPSILRSWGGIKKLRHNNISSCSLCLPLVAMATEFATAASWKRRTTNAESSLVQLRLLDGAKARDTLGDLNVCYHVAFEDDGCRRLLSKSIFTRFLLWHLTAALCQPAMCHPVFKRSKSCSKISTPLHDWKWHTTREASLLIYI